MEMKFSVDEARILQLVMEGLTKKEIEERIADDIKDQAVTYVKDQVLSQTSEVLREIKAEYQDVFINLVKQSIQKELTPQNIAKQFKKEEWETVFGRLAEKTIAEFIEYAFNEWLEININISTPKSKKTVGLCGVNSISRRR